MLTFVGLGLYDERSVTVAGREAVAAADRVFAEFYTGRLTGTTVDRLESYHGAEIELCDRAGVERDPDPILTAAETGDVCFCTAGDTMVSTTHVDLRLRAAERGIDTRVIHGTSAQSAAAGLTGLQNYRFGKAVTLPFPWAHGDGAVPTSVVETIAANQERGLHTLVYLDVKTDPPGDRGDGEQFMTGDVAAELLADAWRDGPGVVVARAGSPDPTVAADRLSALAARSFGDPLHLLVVPGDLHHLEREALAALAGAPEGFGQSSASASSPADPDAS
jgi:diphthine synthase